jgi:RNA polymerase sigma factor (sigma-70 family)
MAAMAATTAMTEVTASTRDATGTMEATDFEGGNDSLFERRLQLKRALELEPAGSCSRTTRHLRRQLDDVTAEIVTFNLGLVRSYCKRFSARASADDAAEFEAAGLLGLMRAIDSFEPTLGRFGSWAFKPIQREVLRAVRSVDHPNLNLTDFERRPEILSAKRRLEGVDVDHIPTATEVAAAVGVTIDQVRRVLHPPELTPIETPTPDGSSTMGEQLRSADAEPEDRVLSQMTLTALRTHGLAALDARELFVIVRRFGLDNEPTATLADIAGSLALSREAVRQIEAKALAKVRHPLVLRKILSHDIG